MGINTDDGLKEKFNHAFTKNAEMHLVEGINFYLASI